MNERRLVREKIAELFDELHLGTDGYTETIHAALTSREPIRGGVKTTLEIDPALHRRMRRYCLDKSTDGRRLLVALLESWLSSEGYCPEDKA